jgi:hypothetical protein
LFILRFSTCRWRAFAVAVAALALAVALLSAASAGVNTPYSGWYSGNPLLSPNRLTDLACAGNTSKVGLATSGRRLAHRKAEESFSNFRLELT